MEVEIRYGRWTVPRTLAWDAVGYAGTLQRCRGPSESMWTGPGTCHVGGQSPNVARQSGQ